MGSYLSQLSWNPGTNGEPGCIRYCSGFPIASNGVDDHHSTLPVSWSKERLIAVDQVHHSLNYEIVESNIGFKSYVSMVRIFPGGDDDQDHMVG